MVSNQRSAIRRRLRAQRRALAPEVVQAAGAAVHRQLGALAFYRAASRVIAYLPTENEIPTADLLAESVATGKEVYLPRTHPAQFERWEPADRLCHGPGGVPEPCGGQPLPRGAAAVACIPVVAWDETGTRLGRGGGYYDRVLARTGGIVRVGLAYEFQYIPEIPRATWDVPLDYIITERRVIPCQTRVTAGLQKGGS